MVPKSSTEAEENLKSGPLLVSQLNHRVSRLVRSHGCTPVDVFVACLWAVGPPRSSLDKCTISSPRSPLHGDPPLLSCHSPSRKYCVTYHQPKALLHAVLKCSAEAIRRPSLVVGRFVVFVVRRRQPDRVVMVGYGAFGLSLCNDAHDRAFYQPR